MKVSEFNQTMAYLLRPKPKMQVAELDSDLEKVIRELNEKFGSGTVQQGTEDIPTPPKTIEREMFQKAFKADGGRVMLGDGSITQVKNISSNIKTNPYYLNLLEKGELYTLRLGADKKTYFGTKEELQEIFDLRPKPGGDRRINLDKQKYPKGYLSRNKFIEFLKTKDINIKSPNVFAKNYKIKTKVNPYFANDLIYDTSKFKNPNFAESIIQRQVKSGFGTDAQKAQYRKFDDESVMRRYFNQLRRKMQKKYSVRKFEEILAANKASGLNLSHMDDLYSQYVTTRNIGYVPKDLNAITLDSYDKAFRDLYKKRNNLFKNKTPGWENKVAKINKDGVKLAKASEGYKQFTVKKPDGKTKVVGVDLQKTVDPDDILKGKKIKDLTDEDLDLLIENRKKIIAKTKPGTISKILKGVGKKIPLAGVILGINEMANAVELGMTEPIDLITAYQTSADVALEGVKMRRSPFYNKPTLAGVGETPDIDPYMASKGGLIKK